MLFPQCLFRQSTLVHPPLSPAVGSLFALAALPRDRTIYSSTTWLCVRLAWRPWHPKYNISSSQSLYVLTAISRHLYRVYSLSDQSILSAVIHKIQHLVVFPDAWAIARLSSCETPFATRGDSSDFIKIYENNRNKFQVPKLLSLTKCIAIFRLHQSIEYFYQDFKDRDATFYW